MQQYKCHKVVSAAKIIDIRLTLFEGVAPGDTWDILLEGDEFVRVPNEFTVNHSPRVGGYLVMDNNKCLSYSPAKAFDDGHVLLDAPCAMSLVNPGNALSPLSASTTLSWAWNMLNIDSVARSHPNSQFLLDSLRSLANQAHEMIKPPTKSS